MLQGSDSLQVPDAGPKAKVTMFRSTPTAHPVPSSPNDWVEPGIVRPTIGYLAGLSVAAGLLVGCGENTKAVPVTECSSGTQWVGGDVGSEEMNPGRDCIACHASRGDGPRFSMAGTVYGGPNAADGCFGVSDAVVRITGADGKVQELTANAAGNFFTNAPFAAPYTAELVRAGVVVAKMQTPQTSGACNACHTANATQGRIQLR